MSNRFSRVPYQAAQDPKLTLGALRTLIALCKYCDEHFIAFPSQKTIADAAGVSRKTVNKSIKLLEERGYIKKKLRRKKNSKRFQVSQYRINFTDTDILATRNASHVTSKGYTGHVTSRGYNSMGTPGVTVTAHSISPHTYQPTSCGDILEDCLKDVLEEPLTEKPEELKGQKDAQQGRNEYEGKTQINKPRPRKPNSKQREMLHVIPGRKANQWEQRNKHDDHNKLVCHCEGLGIDKDKAWVWLMHLGEAKLDVLTSRFRNGRLSDPEILQSMQVTAESEVAHA